MERLGLPHRVKYWTPTDGACFFHAYVQNCNSALVYDQIRPELRQFVQDARLLRGIICDYLEDVVLRVPDDAQDVVFEWVRTIVRERDIDLSQCICTIEGICDVCRPAWLRFVEEMRDSRTWAVGIVVKASTWLFGVPIAVASTVDSRPEQPWNIIGHGCDHDAGLPMVHMVNFNQTHFQSVTEDRNEDHVSIELIISSSSKIISFDYRVIPSKRSFQPKQHSDAFSMALTESQCLGEYRSYLCKLIMSKYTWSPVWYQNSTNCRHGFHFILTISPLMFRNGHIFRNHQKLFNQFDPDHHRWVNDWKWRHDMSPFIARLLPSMIISWSIYWYLIRHVNCALKWYWLHQNRRGLKCTCYFWWMIYDCPQHDLSLRTFAYMTFAPHLNLPIPIVPFIRSDSVFHRDILSETNVRTLVFNDLFLKGMMSTSYILGNEEKTCWDTWTNWLFSVWQFFSQWRVSPTLTNSRSGGYIGVVSFIDILEISFIDQFLFELGQ